MTVPAPAKKRLTGLYPGTFDPVTLGHLDIIKRAVKLVDHRCLVEVSGGVTLDTVAEYAATGADLVAIGALTHSAPVLDIGMDLC